MGKLTSKNAPALDFTIMRDSAYIIGNLWWYYLRRGDVSILEPMKADRFIREYKSGPLPRVVFWGNAQDPGEALPLPHSPQHSSDPYSSW